MFRSEDFERSADIPLINTNWTDFDISRFILFGLDFFSLDIIKALLNRYVTFSEGYKTPSHAFWAGQLINEKMDEIFSKRNHEILDHHTWIAFNRNPEVAYSFTNKLLKTESPRLPVLIFTSGRGLNFDSDLVKDPQNVVIGLDPMFSNLISDGARVLSLDEFIYSPLTEIEILSRKLEEFWIRRNRVHVLIDLETFDFSAKGNVPYSLSTAFYLQFHTILVKRLKLRSVTYTFGLEDMPGVGSKYYSTIGQGLKSLMIN